jgi:hypothetical protein
MWSIDPCDKLTVPQLVKKFPAFNYSQNLITVPLNLPLVPIQSHKNPFHFPTCFY